MLKIVTYFGTKNVYTPMAVSAKSLLMHSRVDHVFFFIEDDVFPDPLPDIISCVNVSGQKWFSINTGSPWTYMANMRFTLGKLLPNADSVLYLDTDTLILKDVSPAFDINLSGKLFAMVEEGNDDVTIEYMNGSFVLNGNLIQQLRSTEPRPPYPVRPYYNSGVMLMNLDQLRLTHMDDTLIDAVNHPHKESEYPDQDAINILCHDFIVPMPQEYNVISNLTPDFHQDRIRIKHYASDKPLWKSGLWQSYRRLSWDDVMKHQHYLQKEERIDG